LSLLEVKDITKSYRVGRGRQRQRFLAADHVSFELAAGETLGLVGETGAGKSTVGRLVLRLSEADSGSITFDGMDVRALGGNKLRDARKRMQMVFQDPYSCLDPRIPVVDSVAEPLLIHFDLEKGERRERAEAALDRVGLGPQMFYRLPHELSGGQLQRVAVARSLTLDPLLIVCDEPVAALDASVRAQVINLLADLQDDLGIAYLFITHDLGTLETFADRVAVMQNGQIVEMGSTAELMRNPQTEYARTLLESIPSVSNVLKRQEARH
jgi:ABC-type oligopeptide transport system ATPase subunit